MDAGNVAESGSHEELMTLGGRYAELYETQSRYYEEEVQADGGE